MYDVLNEKSPNAGGDRQEGNNGDLNCTADETRGQLFSCDDAAKFGDDDMNETLVEGLLVKGKSALICAPQKCLKTTLSIDLAISLASGTPFLGHFPVPRRVRTIVFSGESGAATLKETLIRICRSKGFEREHLSGWLSLTCELPHLGNPKHVEELREGIPRCGFEVGIFDPAYLMLNGDNAGNLFDMGQQLRRLDIPGFTPIVNHHANAKARATYRPLTLEAPSFAGFREYFRQYILLNRRAAYKVGTGHHELWFGWAGSDGQSGQLKLDVDEGPNTSLQGREYRLKIIGEESEHKPAGRVADVISALYPDRQETARSLRSLTGMGASAVEHSLEESISRGMIEAKSSLVRGKPSTVYSLTELGRGSHQGLV
jgi:hypothetical protein